MMDREKPPRICPVHKGAVPEGNVCGVDGCRFGAEMTDEEIAAQRESWVRGEMGMGETVAGNVSSFNKERANRARNSNLWTVEDMLRATLEELPEYGWSKAVVTLYRSDGTEFAIDFRVAGCTTLEARGLQVSWLEDEFNR